MKIFYEKYMEYIYIKILNLLFAREILAKRFLNEILGYNFVKLL